MTRVPEAAGPLDWSLLSGAVPVTVAVVGAVALLLLCFSRHRGWWLRRAPLALLVAGALTWLVARVVDDWWQPFPEGLPSDSLLWIGVGILAVVLVLFRMPGLRWRERGGMVGCGALVLLLCASQLNVQFQEYPTLRAAPGPWKVKAGPLSAEDLARRPTVSVPDGQALSQVWKPPAGLPATGTLATTAIPGTVSHFAARDAHVYLPPAYQASPRPRLPVLVLLAGQPGSPDDWVDSGQLVTVLDGFAAAHQGLAPVVAVVDPLGSAFANTLCLDSRIAQAQTYLARDVPDWIGTHLQVATGRGATAIGGLSFGGTCSLQLAVNAPDVYGSFLDISGQDEPTLGSRDKTVSKAFGGDAAAFAKVNPLDVMARRSFPHTAGAIVSGASDSIYTPQQQRVLTACRQAGMDVTWRLLPGGHSWQVWRAGLEQELPWVAQHTGLTP
ncbi:alpha/beta hydrolase [Streptacidiphilus sp. N1-3]|uniref:Alpha/beta hydrolase n=1 Tax=Streptacidiphilus alkalitolerans TaxID=3342712 RepID=A0ABV6X2G3_9ACTN